MPTTFSKAADTAARRIARSRPRCRLAEQTFGVPQAKPYISICSAGDGTSDADLVARDFAVSLGVGENPAKRIPDPFEERLLALLSAGGATLAIDKGAGGDEAARVERAVGRSGVKAAFWKAPSRDSRP